MNNNASACSLMINIEVSGSEQLNSPGTEALMWWCVAHNDVDVTDHVVPEMLCYY